MKCLPLLFIILASPVFGQLVFCDSTTTYWVADGRYVMTIGGPVQARQHKNMVQAGGYVLQAVTVAKAPYLDSSGNKPLEVMSRYALREGKYISEQLKQNVDLQMQTAPLSEEESVLIWFYYMPPSVTKEVTMQLFANRLVGDAIFGIAAPVFSDQHFEDVRDFLMDVISTLKVVQKQSELEALCR